MDGYATEDELFEMARLVFQADFITAGTTFDKHAVMIDNVLTQAGWEASFEHLVTRETVTGQPRERDVARAKRVPWVKPHIHNYLDPEIVYFMYLEGSGYVRHYIWNQPDNHVVILESKSKKIFLVTSFVIDKAWKERDLQKKLDKAIK